MMRLRLILAWTIWIVLCTAVVLAQPVPVTRVEAVGLTVSDMDRSVEFYVGVLHFRKLSDVELSGSQIEHLKGLFGIRVRIVQLQLGDEILELSEYLAPTGRPLPVDSRSNDLWFQHVAIVVSDMDQAYAWLRQNRVRYVSSGPQTLPSWNRQASGIQAFYFHDPDDHVLEVIHFPARKGDPRWQHNNGDLFLGIDHTAIAVSNTDASLRFYRDVLGMKIAGASENYGDEQEHLNNVFGAHLKVTSLRAPSGAGIELLEYLAPRSGRPIPEDLKANDIAHWETVIESPDMDAAWAYFSKTHTRLISSGVGDVQLSSGSRKGFLLEDPDGHVLTAMNELSSGKASAQGR
jgi:catechol 2,3-dioxygenase-like lactoylglutathione lyase family enzyme